MKTPESMTDYLKLTDAQKMELAGLPSVPSNALFAIAVAALKRIAACEDAPAIDAEGDWQIGLHCGVEDRNCRDRYHGADYGHTVGVEKALEWASNEAKAALEKMADDKAQILSEEKYSGSPCWAFRNRRRMKMKARVNLKSDPISLTVLAASGIDHMAMEKVGHDGIMDIGVESVGETAFEKELTHLINQHSIENVADMPDFLLAGMICRMIEAMGPNIKKTLDWHGCNSVCHPSPNVRVSGPCPPETSHD